MIAEAIHSVRERIERAEKSVGRTDSVLLLAVSKNHPVEAIEAAVANGIVAVGENRVQEAKAKIEAYQGPDVEWHLIGHLQINKVRQAVPLFDLIHSVDSEKLMREIDRIANREGKVQRILLQVNVAREESKSGVSVEEFPALVELAKTLENIEVQGIMCMAPFVDNVEEVRPVFRIASYLYEDMKNKFPDGQIQFLSMGMSHDFEVAIQEGANIVRVGTDIFGQRDYGCL